MLFSKVHIRDTGKVIIIFFAYMPKTTVQAAIGGLPLAMGLACGDIVLTVAVLSIIITAPIGAMLIIDMFPHTMKLTFFSLIEAMILYGRLNTS